ncbi:Endonuclease III [Granulicella sibirica]|uniref:Endonuclease III n=1 Tax=Granulicella sibirica TaxID=2479048 RepID=A0A4Q0T2C4_9BACT|nr:Endonuclease III [Granulicella sibirica]
MAPGKKAAKSAKKVITPLRPVPKSPEGAAARAIAATEPVAPKKRPGRTARPTSPERVAAILDALRKTYPGVVCALNHHNAWELTVATILSAQCTDVRVNIVTPDLFRAFPTPAAMAKATLPELEELIRTTGFYRNKAKSILGAAKLVSGEYGGEIPQTMEEMLRIPGVARKTANVVLGSWFGIASGVVVDTHVLRLSRRLELTKESTPEKIEKDLEKILPKDRWIAFSHELIHHGRQICIARKPRCADCTLETLCNSIEKTWSSH